MRTLYTYDACGHSRLGRVPPSGRQRVSVPGECNGCKANHACRCQWASYWVPGGECGLHQLARRIGATCERCQRDQHSASVAKQHAWDALEGRIAA